MTTAFGNTMQSLKPVLSIISCFFGLHTTNQWRWSYNQTVLLKLFIWYFFFSLHDRWRCNAVGAKVNNTLFMRAGRCWGTISAWNKLLTTLIYCGLHHKWRLVVPLKALKLSCCLLPAPHGIDMILFVVANRVFILVITCWSNPKSTLGYIFLSGAWVPTGTQAEPLYIHP